jgi:hypothetical protein
MTLYELTGEYADLMAQYESAETDEEAEAIWEQIDGLACDIAVKADAYARVMRNKLADSVAYQAEADRLSKLASREKTRAERLMESIRNAMIQVGATEIPTSIGTWKTKLNPPKCDVTDIKAVPEQFRVPIEPPEVPYTVDKAAAKKWFKETGEIIPGLNIEQKTAIVFK